MTVDGVIVTPEERKGVQEHYEARLAVMDRYSDRQLQELKRQLEGERKLTEEEKKPYIKKIQDRIYEGCGDEKSRRQMGGDTGYLA